MAKTLWLKRVKNNPPPNIVFCPGRMLLEPLWTNGPAPRVGPSVRDAVECIKAKNPKALQDEEGNWLCCGNHDYVSDDGNVTNKAGTLIDFKKRTCNYESGIIVMGQVSPGMHILRHNGNEVKLFKGLQLDGIEAK